jgi:hypothetical protein
MSAMSERSAGLGGSILRANTRPASAAASVAASVTEASVTEASVIEASVIEASVIEASPASGDTAPSLGLSERGPHAVITRPAITDASAARPERSAVLRVQRVSMRGATRGGGEERGPFMTRGAVSHERAPSLRASVLRSAV